MKKLLSVGLALALGSAFVPVAAHATITATECAELAGLGTSASPYLVSNEADLMAVSSCNSTAGGSAEFKQTANIVLEGDWTSLEQFDGLYDGNYWSISGLNVNTPAIWGVGLFAALENSTVRNLTVLANSLTGENYAGVIAAYSKNVLLENLRVKTLGTLTANLGAGCLVGFAAGVVTINNVFSDCNTAASVQRAGGLFGQLGATDDPAVDVDISNAYVTADISFALVGGGIAGLFVTTDTAASVSGFTFAGSLNAPNSQTAMVGGLFGSAAAAPGATTAPITAVTNSSVRGSINSELVTLLQVITLPPSLASSWFSSQAVVDFSTTPFRVSPTVGSLTVSGKGATSPRFVLSKMILAPKYGRPVDSDGYRVNVGLLAITGFEPSFVYYTAPAVARFTFERVDSMTLITPSQDSDLTVLAGLQDVAVGIENVTAGSTWVTDSSIANGAIWGAQLVRLALHESTLDYGQESFEIAHDEIFSALNSSWNFFPEFTISPALPTGITLESHTGRIIGSAAQAFGPTSYTITRTSLFSHPTQTTSITLSQLADPEAAQTPTVGSSPGSFSGPAVSGLSPNPVTHNALLTIFGERLLQVSEVVIGDTVITASEMTVTDTQLSFVVPAAAPLGQQPLVLVGSFGSLTYQNGVEVLAETVRFEVRRQANGDLKLYAFGILNQGKIQFKVDGQELAWVRATTNQNAGVRTIVTTSGSEHYLVRTLKNLGNRVVEFFHNNQLVKTHN